MLAQPLQRKTVRLCARPVRLLLRGLDLLIPGERRQTARTEEIPSSLVSGPLSVQVVARRKYGVNKYETSSLILLNVWYSFVSLLLEMTPSIFNLLYDFKCT